MYAKKFDRLTKDWSLYRDGEYIGSQGSVREIEALELEDRAQRRARKAGRQPQWRSSGAGDCSTALPSARRV